MSERIGGVPAAQRIAAATVVTLLMLAAGLFGFYAGRQQRPQPPTVRPAPIAHRTGRMQVRLSLGVLMPGMGVNTNDMPPPHVASPGGLVSSVAAIEPLLGTRSYPTPPYPTLTQFRRLQREAAALLAEYGVDVVPDSGPAGGSDATRRLSVTRDLYEVNGASFQRVRVRLEEYQYDPATRVLHQVERLPVEYEYLGARKNVDTWAWTHKAVLYSLQRFLDIYYGGQGPPTRHSKS
jgi:hypothetical protein